MANDEFPANAALEAALAIPSPGLDFRTEIRRLPSTRCNRAWPCSVALTQRASVRFLLCVGRIDLRFAAECESRHSWDTTIQKSAIPPWKPAVLLRIRFVDLRREGFTN